MITDNEFEAQKSRLLARRDRGGACAVERRSDVDCPTRRSADPECDRPSECTARAPPRRGSRPTDPVLGCGRVREVGAADPWWMRAHGAGGVGRMWPTRRRPAGFWKHVRRAVGRRVEDRLHRAEIVEGGSPPVPSAELCERLPRPASPAIIVIDDFHLLPCHPARWSRSSATYRPGSGSCSPPVPTPVLGLASAAPRHVLEIRQADLRFTLDETAAALAAIRVELDETRCATPRGQRGLPAGVHLLGLSLRSVEPSASSPTGSLAIARWPTSSSTRCSTTPGPTSPTSSW